jgi:hypothetical protein
MCDMTLLTSQSGGGKNKRYICKYRVGYCVLFGDEMR